MQTHFAPAERATAAGLQQNIGRITNNPIIDTLMSASYGLFAVLNGERQILSLNRSFLDLMGIDNAEKILGLRPGEYLKCIHSAEMPAGCGASESCHKCGAVVAQLAALETDVSQEGSCELTVMRDSGLLQLSFQVKCCRSIIDGEVFLLMFLQDTSDLKQQAYQELKTVIETASDGFWITDPQGRLLDVNQSYCVMSGYARQELLAMSIDQIDPAENGEQVRSRIRRILLDGSARFEARHRRRDGSCMDVEVSATCSAELGGRVYSFIRDITERKRDERALAESRAQLEALIESTDDFIWSVDCRSFGLLTFNSAYRDYFSRNYRLSLVRGMTPDDLLPANLAERWLAYYQRALTEGSYSTEFATDDGSVTLSLSFNLLRRDGETYGISVFGKSVAELRQAEDALLESEKRFQILTDTTFEGVVISRDGRILEVNDRLTGMLGYERHELIGMAISQCIAPADRERIVANVRDNVECILEHDMVKKDGSVITVEAHGKPVYYAGNKLRLTAIRDITERKLADELLRSSELYFRSIFEQAAVGIVMCDVRGRFIRTNGRYRDLVGYSEQELSSLTFWDITFDDDLPENRETWRRVLAPESGSVIHEKRYVRKDGTLVWSEVYLSIVRDQAGAPLFSIAIVQDLTKRKQAERKLLSYQAQLNSLASELSLVQERERRRIAFEIHDHVVQNLSLGKIMLSNCISTGSFGKLPQVSAILSESIRQMRSLIFDLSSPLLYEMGLIPALEELGERLGREHGFAFSLLDNFTSPPLEEPLLVGVFQSVRELLLNAVKHARAANVTLSAENEGDFLRMSLEDDGVGFEVDSVFDKASRQHSIGLFGVQQRLHYLGGSFEIESSTGRGTRIVLLVPLTGHEAYKEGPNP
jgi:PAS domain S-box-containing protein